MRFNSHVTFVGTFFDDQIKSNPSSKARLPGQELPNAHRARAGAALAPLADPSTGGWSAGWWLEMWWVLSWKICRSKSGQWQLLHLDPATRKNCNCWMTVSLLWGSSQFIRVARFGLKEECIQRWILIDIQILPSGLQMKRRSSIYGQ